MSKKFKKEELVKNCLLFSDCTINLAKSIPRKLSKSDLLRRKIIPKRKPIEIKPVGSTSQASLVEKPNVNTTLDTRPKKVHGNFVIRGPSVQPDATDSQTFKLPQVNNKFGNKHSVGIKRVDSKSFNKPTATQATRGNQSNTSFRINSYSNSDNTTHSLPQSVSKDDEDEDDDDESIISMAVNPDLEKFVNDNINIKSTNSLTKAEKLNKVRNFIQNQVPYSRSTTLIPPMPMVRNFEQNRKSHSSTAVMPPRPAVKTDSIKSNFSNGYIRPSSPSTVSNVESVANKYSVSRSPTFSDDEEEDEDDPLAFKRRNTRSVEFTRTKQTHANESKFENPPVNSHNQLEHRMQSESTFENLQSNSQNQLGPQRQGGLSFENLQQHHDKFSTSPVEPKTVSVTNGYQLSENDSDEVLPYESPFSGYCLSYLRRSVIQGQYHRCVLKHEIPSVMFEHMNLSRQYSGVVQAIKEVCQRNFSNPPIPFLEQIVAVLFVNPQNKQWIETIVQSMTRHISVENSSHERYVEIWSSFLRSLIRKIVQHHKEPELYINQILSKVIAKHGLTAQVNKEILLHALSELAKVTSSSNFKLLACTDFMRGKGRFPVSLCPEEFIVTVIQQFMNKMKKTNDPKPSFKYKFKIYKTFFSNFDDCLLVHKANRSLAEEFLETAQELVSDRDVHSLIYKLRLRNPLPNTVVCIRVQDNCGLNNAGHDNGVQKRVIENGAVSPANEAARNFQQARSSTSSESSSFRLADAARNHQQPRPSTSGESSSFRLADWLRKFPPEGVFEQLKSNGAVNYLKLLQQCEGVMKKKCNDITMSFILLESENKESDCSKLCYNLFQHMMDFHPNNVQDYATGRSTSANRLLVVAKCCLRTCHVKEAVNLFLRFGLFEADHSKWLLEKSPEDINLWGQLCKEIEAGLGKIPQYSDDEAEMFKSIIHQQKSLRAPVCLFNGLNKLFLEVANLYQHLGWNPIAEIVLLIVKENLLKQLILVPNELYRILIKAVCNANIPGVEIDVPDVCARLMKRSNSVCEIYPKTWNKDCNELTLMSCLTVEELQAYLMFKIKVFKKMLELKSLHVTFEEYENTDEEWKQPFFRNVDASISGVIERFKVACLKIGLNLSSLIVSKNKVIVDKIIAGVNQNIF